MATVEVAFLHSQLEERRRKLQAAMAVAPQNNGLAQLLHEVDSALERMDKGTYGLCETCHESVEQDRLLADPLVRYCLDHLSDAQRVALQRDLELAAQVQRRLLPAADLRADGWATSYHYSPVGPVSGDYCDLIPSEGRLLFVVGDVSGKGVAASMLMTQLHALFRGLAGMSVPLGQMVAQANRMFCESSLAGQYATLVCGHAKPSGEVEIHNAGHWPAVLVGRGGVLRVESTGLPLGMFLDAEFSATRVQLEPGDTLFLYTDGLCEARDNAGSEYGVERVLQLARQHSARPPAEMITACLNDLSSFSSGAPRLDDLTLLAIRRHT
jgi:sigma-B regulation protein RsbU (phosphoserine phosphatase)